MPLLASRIEKDNYINEITSKMSYVDIRKKGRVSISGIVAVINHFSSHGIDFDISNSAHKISSVLEEFGITDIYYNGYRTDVITTLDDVVAIPKKHFEYDIAPDFYYVIKLQNDLRIFETIGCLRTEDVLNAKSDSNFYYPDEFMNPQEYLDIIKRKNPVEKSVIGSHKDCEALFLRFLEHELSYSYKKSFIKHILSCPECMEKLRYLERFDDFAKLSTSYPDLTERYYRQATGDITARQAISYERNMKIKNAISSTKDFVKSMFLKSHENKVENKKQENFANDEDCINYIFNNRTQNMKLILNNVLEKKNFNKILVIFGIIFSLVVFGIVKSSTNIKEQELPQEEFLESDDFEGNISSENDFEQLLGGEIQEPAEITEVSTQVNKISWEIPKKLSKNDLYIKFLQMTGKNIQVNLQNDLLLTRAIPTNKHVKVDVTFKNYGSIVSLKTIKGSGSDEIDQMIEKNIFAAFSYVRPPKADLRNVDLTLLIEL